MTTKTDPKTFIRRFRQTMLATLKRSKINPDGDWVVPYDDMGKLIELADEINATEEAGQPMFTLRVSAIGRNQIRQVYFRETGQILSKDREDLLVEQLNDQMSRDQSPTFEIDRTATISGRPIRVTLDLAEDLE